ncbi:intraflagellar transport protein 46 homolog [Corticium candelabrum]|uniref:intraflagellar transport protein 46 homolog n=1 Tax=Corticium candelabrum TaxID=121492 RepID=UPI002E25BBF0|nr:intraflagellar transport protein 46 homolog [Corticium candelabrum]
MSDQRFAVSSDDEEEGQVVSNQPYDEALDVSDQEEVPSTFSSPQVPPTRPQQQGTKDALQEAMASGSGAGGSKTAPAPSYANQSGTRGVEGHQGVDLSGSDDSDEEEEDMTGAALEGVYDPADFTHLPVSADIQDLFQHITRYKPQQIELETKLKPFIPDYIPSVGDIDAFLKMPRPDGQTDQLGLIVLDEPCAKQSDPTVLDLQLRTLTKQPNLKAMTVHNVADVQKNPKALDNWIQSMNELHRQKPPQNVHYQWDMPSVDALMQTWPPEFEELLQSTSLPSAELDCELKDFVDIVCGLLDIPVHSKNRLHSLHLLFSLYSEFKNSQHFRTETSQELYGDLDIERNET